MKFTHLHVHSHYSLLDGLPKIDQLLDYAKKLGMDAIALTDHGALYGAVEFFKKAKERDIKPIIGAEMYLAFEDYLQRRPKLDDIRYHMVLLVKNEQGYKNLVKLITKAHLEGFYYKPRIDENLLAQHHEGLIALSGCLQGKIPRLIIAKKMDEAEKTAAKYLEIFGKENFYLELQHHPNIKEQTIVNEGLIALSKKLGLSLVATTDSHYLKPEDAEAQDVLMLINTGAKSDDPERLTLKADDFSLKSPQQMAEHFKEIPEALENTQKISELCSFEFSLGKIKLPYFEVPESKTPDSYLKELAFQGSEKRFDQGLNPETKERLNYELSVIEKTGFAPYFLIIQDFVKWAKENRIVVGPGRGSAAGSLVSYCLGITNVDPLKYNLLFERFINPDRISPPDIDLDFTDRRRDEVINYVSQKYGQERVAQIITFGTMASRAVIRDVGRALEYPYSYCDQLAKMIPFGLTLQECLKNVAEFRQFYQTDTRAQRLIDLAQKLEGVARHASTHACGVVISKEPLENLVPLQHPTQDDSAIVTQYEMKSIEDLGLLKMDFLGLKNLTIIEDALLRVYAVHKQSIDIEKLPLDDKATYQLLQKGNTIGVFQLESQGMQKYLKELKPTEFEDIIAMIALYRPGPIQFIQDYIDRKHKRKRVEYLHPALKSILEKTQGICIYQEQLMQIAQKLAGFSLAQADILRKAVGKKIEKLLLEQKEKLIRGMINNGIEIRTAQEIWEWILPFARYGFNRSHSASYATIAYQTAFLKTHWPVEFMASLLTSERNDVERIGFLIEECKKMGIEVLPPDINESFINFSVVPDKNQIRFGLLAIKNVGENVVEAIIRERKNGKSFQSMQDFVLRVNSKDLNKRSLESLIKAGAFDKLAERNQLLANLEKILEWSRESQKSKNESQMGLFSGLKFVSELNLTPTKPATEKEKLEWEKELLGLYITGHPLQRFQSVFSKKTLPIAQIIASAPPRNQVRIGGIISQIKKIITRKGLPMLFVKLEDLTDRIEVVVFPAIIERNPTAFQENKIVMVTGRVEQRDNVPKMICDEIQEMIEAA